jgi:hypothetical protein
MTELSCSLISVTLSQPNAFQPQLNVRLDIKYPNYTNQPQTGYIQITNVKVKLRVKGNNPTQFEIGVAEQEQMSSVRLGDMSTLYLTVRLSPYLLHRVEELRLGGELWFQFEPITSGLSVTSQGGLNNVDIINWQITGNTWKYPKSEWIDHLNATEFNKIELIEIPKIELPKIPLTEHVMKFLTQANKAMNEGRYGDVLKECRNVIDALDNGMEEWVKTITLTEEENKIIQNGKQGSKREIYLSKLIGDKEKAVRLSKVIGDIHFYFSLNPHEAEYKGMEFIIDDAKFVIHTVTSLSNNILKYMTKDS